MKQTLPIFLAFLLLAAVVGSDNDTKPMDCRCNDGDITLGVTGSMEISSPNYPGDYCPNAHCEWRISAPYNQLYVAFIIEHMDTQQYEDWIRIYDGRSTGSNQIESCSGTTCSNITSGGRYMTITFTSDSSIQRSGFLARISAAQQPQCTCLRDERVPLGYSGSKTITSPNYPYHYCNNLDCGWTVYAPSSRNNYKIKLQFSSFQTEVHQDILKIYDGSNSHGELLESCSGSSCNSTTSTSNYMFIEFETDQTITYSGFSATVTATTDGCQQSCSDNEKYLYYDGDQTTISSPTNLCSDTDCEWTVEAVITSDVIRLSFYTFNLGDQDYVEVFDGSSVYSKSIQTCYGYSSYCNSVTSSNNRITIKFHSQSGTTSMGYRFAATAYATSGSLGVGAIVAISIGTMVLVFLLLALIIAIHVRRRRRQFHNRIIPTATPVVPPSVTGYTNPNAQYPSSAVYAPPPTYNQATVADETQSQPKIC